MGSLRNKIDTLNPDYLKTLEVGGAQAKLIAKLKIVGTLDSNTKLRNVK